jgi:hypothetical protein
MYNDKPQPRNVGSQHQHLKSTNISLESALHSHGCSMLLSEGPESRHVLLYHTLHQRCKRLAAFHIPSIIPHSIKHREDISYANDVPQLAT